ncbi:nucleobase:cation symporter-2 family protein [Methylobacterium sp. A54F]
MDRAETPEADSVDAMLPLPRLLAYGMQHVLVMSAGAVAPPLIIGAAMGLPTETVAYLINCDLLVTGLAILIQSFGLGPFGVRLPVIMGVSFASVGPMVAMAQDPAIGLPGIFGATIAAGIFGLMMRPFFYRLVGFFPPLVTGTVILIIGVTLLPVGINWAGGGFGAPDFGAPVHLGVAALVLAAILVVSRFATGFVANIAVLIGLCVGLAAAWPLGLFHLEGLAARPVVEVVTPFRFGLPTFHLTAVVAMCIVMMVTLVESTGMFLAVGDIVGRKVDRPMLTRGLMADALSTTIAGVLNTFPHTSFSQNVGLVNMTRVRSRYVTATAGLIILAVSLLPKLAYVVASIPPAVLGGAGIVIFGMVASAGLKIVGGADLGDRRNQIVVAVSIGLSLIPMAAPKFFAATMPDWTGPILHSGITLGSISAIVLNLLLNSDRLGQGHETAHETAHETGHETAHALPREAALGRA